MAGDPAQIPAGVGIEEQQLAAAADREQSAIGIGRHAADARAGQHEMGVPQHGDQPKEPGPRGRGLGYPLQDHARSHQGVDRAQSHGRR